MTDLCVKINVDGSCFGNLGRSRFGGLIRNNAGEWISSFTGFYGFSTNLHVELLAIFHGLKLVWDSGFKNVICESDSQLALSLIVNDGDKFHPQVVVIKRIKSLINLLLCLTLKHTLREGNEGVDWFAKYGADNDHLFFIWGYCPTQLSYILLFDVVGVVRLRH
ncbi:PREDICTED: uncharacterized protein LOC109350462 [Lupinus angustifolius]|uniref:uncharacterized protein LOC109350462 n=1 Tax=Lupinus angustifolius TaxID=3871 RepID=UPI00092F1A78|nr:PREDICTED: uncharacterized protein LOC109350462 [Lupinus angustifolius]